MAFTSFTYLYLLIAAAAAYWMLPWLLARKWLLIIVSYLFYGWITPWYALLLLACNLVTYGCLRGIWSGKNTQISLALGITWNLGTLATFKYWNFLIEAIGERHGSPYDTWKIVLPIGISFYALQAIGMIVDAYRSELQRTPFTDVMLFVSFFPKLIAGPFEKSTTFLLQFAQKQNVVWQNAYDALRLLLLGIMKKLVVAENVKIYVDQIFILSEPSWLLLATGAIGFSIQILADFSGYTDIARGSAALFGIRLTENFQNPYLAISPSDFWRRWHITLSSWFKNYVYIPLGGSYGKNEWRVAFSMITTMGISGMWHGATWNFLLWGVYYGILLCCYRWLGLDHRWAPKNIITHSVAWLTMTIFTLFGWLLFRATDMEWLASSLMRQPSNWTAEIAASISWLGTIFLFATPWCFCAALGNAARRNAFIAGVCMGIACIGILALSVEQMTDFIYFKF